MATGTLIELDALPPDTTGVTPNTTGERIVGTGATSDSGSEWVDYGSSGGGRGHGWVDYGSSGGGGGRSYNRSSGGYNGGYSGGDSVPSPMPAFARASSRQGGPGFNFDQFAAEMGQAFGGFGGNTGQDLGRDYTATDFMDQAGGNRTRAERMARTANFTRKRRNRKGRTSTSPDSGVPSASGLRTSILRSLAEIGLPVSWP